MGGNKKEIDPKQSRCTKLKMSAPVTFSDNSGEKNSFEIKAYTGAPVRRFWGDLVIDVDGIRAKQQMPIFLNHNRGQIVGYSQKNWKDDSAFFVSGEFSRVTDEARKAKALAEENFPWQASIGVMPLKILELESGAEETVNGRKIKGPADIWKQSEVVETSFVPLGADGNTSVSIFDFEGEPAVTDTDYTLTRTGGSGSYTYDSDAASHGAKHKQQEKERNSMEITREKFEKEAPDLFAQLIDEGRKEGHAEGLEEGAGAERNRIMAVFEQSMPGHEDLVRQLAFDGKTTGPEAAVKVLAAERKVRGDKGEDLGADGEKPVDHTSPPDESGGPAGGDESLSVEERAKQNWEKDNSLKKEFDSFESYLAYLEAMDAGLVKELKDREK